MGEELSESVRKQILRGPVLDLAYGSRSSGWEKLAARHGVSYRGGREFLARQAVGQFRRWTGRDVPVAEFMKGFPEGVGVEKR
jgi:shikimate 5-dehydrogenase